MAERKHRHIVEIGLALLAQSGLPTIFWDDSSATAVYIINKLLSPIIQSSSPHEKLYKTLPNYYDPKVFGCLCYPHLRPFNKSKLDFRSARATFLGYSSSHKGYKALLGNGKVIITRDILFDESVFPHKSLSHTNQHQSAPNSTSSDSTLFSAPIMHHPASPHITHSPLPDSCPATSPSSNPDRYISLPLTDPTSTSPSLPSPLHVASPTPSPMSSSPSPSIPIISSTLTSSPSQSKKHHVIARSQHGIFKPKALTSSSNESDERYLVIPHSARVAIVIPVWRCAMNEECLVLLRNNTWTLTNLPPGKTLLDALIL